MLTSESGSGAASLSRTVGLSRLKMVVFAAIASDSVRMTAADSQGVRSIRRTAWRTSVRSASITGRAS